MKNKFEKLLNSRIRKKRTNRNGSKNTAKENIDTKEEKRITF